MGEGVCVAMYVILVVCNGLDLSVGYVSTSINRGPKG